MLGKGQDEKPECEGRRWEDDMLEKNSQGEIKKDEK